VLLGLYKPAHVWVPISGGRSFRRDLLDTLQTLLREGDLSCGDVFLEVLAALGARDGDDIVPLMQEPGEGELSRRRVLLGGDLPDPVRQLQVPPTDLSKDC
jgi:hypothetical protein